MSSFPVLRRVLQSRRRPLSIWTVALGGVCGMYTSLYPMMEKVNLQEMMEALPPAMVEALGYDDMTSAAGYVGSATYGLVAMALLLVFGIGNGAKILAGHEEAGDLELELTSPLSRQTIYAQRLAALWVQISVLVAMVLLVTLVLNAAQSLGIPLDDLMAGTLGLWLLTGLFGSLAFAVGAATGRRAVALGVAAGAAVVGWMFNAIGPTVGVDWMSAVSPLGWYMADNPLTRGFQPLGSSLLAVTTVVVLVAGWMRFLRRDLMT
ncbi:MAG: ABC transporter permease subunit [Deltaproteobacteria bacterium]|nr:ABC transporter permease subunit [Deltaproteobacteria bacterium]